MSSNNCIIPECYIDSCLIEVLLYADKDHVNHQKGNGTVGREMKNSFSDNFCVGIIDEDRRKLDYLNQFDIVIETDYLRLWKDQKKAHYMVQIRPVIEYWILAACEKEGIALKKFDLPNEITELKRLSKSIVSKKDQRFIGLFKEMVKREVRPVIQLKEWLIYLKENTFNVDINRFNNG